MCWTGSHQFREPSLSGWCWSAASTPWCMNSHLMLVTTCWEFNNTVCFVPRYVVHFTPCIMKAQPNGCIKLTQLSASEHKAGVLWRMVMHCYVLITTKSEPARHWHAATAHTARPVLLAHLSGWLVDQQSWLWELGSVYSVCGNAYSYTQIHPCVSTLLLRAYVVGPLGRVPWCDRHSAVVLYLSAEGSRNPPRWLSG